MKRLRLSTMLIALSVSAAGVGAAGAENPKPSAPQAPQTPQQTPLQTPQQTPPQTPQQPAKPATTAEPRRTSAEVLQIAQQAKTHIEAARAALARGDKATASRALTVSGEALGKLYAAPELAEVLNELDTAIGSIEGEGGKQSLDRLNLAPLSAAVRRHQLYLDPSIVAGINEAAAKAKQGDARATTDALRLARDRIAFDVALLPVEDAYVRVLAAQQAIDRGDLQEARRFLQSVPIVIAVLQVESPLVPVRFKLNAAALAAEQGNWARSQALVREATAEVQAIERIAKGSPSAPVVSALADDVERLDRQMGSGPRPPAQQIRELARRTRELGG